jgi:hypothetical protein
MDSELFWTGYVIGAASVVGLLLVVGVGLWIVRPWIRMKMTGGSGSLLQILAMRLRGNPTMLIVEAYTSLIHSGDKVHLMEVESQFVANRAKVSSSSDLMEIVREFKRRESTAENRRKKK